MADIGIDHIIDTGVWSSGTDRILEGIWEWADPTSHVYESIDQQVYTNWAPGQPDGGLFIS